jgi:hypothetical protein
MASNVNLTRTTLPQGASYLTTLHITWLDEDNNPQDAEETREMNSQLNWFKTNCDPTIVAEMIGDWLYQIERIRQGIDTPEGLA